MKSNLQSSVFPTVITDPELEKNVLGSILSHTRALEEVRPLLCPECFSTTMHQDVYKAILSLAEKCEPVDMQTAHTEMKRLGTAEKLTAYHLAEMCNAWSPHYYNNALVINELHVRNKAWVLAQNLSKKAGDLTFDIGNTVEEVSSGLAGIFDTPASGITNMKEAGEMLYTRYIDKNVAGTANLTGTPTGFSKFDQLSGGLQPGNLVIVAGETSQGKTSFATAIVTSAAHAGHPVAFYSMEMTATELFARIAAGSTNIPSRHYLHGKLNANQLREHDKAFRQLCGLPIYFDDKSTSNIDVILASIRVMALRKGIRGVVVDYLQILNVNMKGINKEQQMGEVTRRLKNLAKELGIWIIALSQLNRDDKNHLPALNRLRDSGQIAEAADIVILLYRPAVYRQPYPKPFHKVSVLNTALVDIAKGRNIGQSRFIVGFDPSVTRFYNLNHIPTITPDEMQKLQEEEEGDQPF